MAISVPSGLGPPLRASYKPYKPLRESAMLNRASSPGTAALRNASRAAIRLYVTATSVALRQYGIASVDAGMRVARSPRNAAAVGMGVCSRVAYVGETYRRYIAGVADLGAC
jgi:hypothetical protein